MQVGNSPGAFLDGKADQPIAHDMDMIPTFEQQRAETRRQIRKTLLCLPGTTTTQNGLTSSVYLTVGGDADDRFTDIGPYVTNCFSDYALLYCPFSSRSVHVSCLPRPEPSRRTLSTTGGWE